MNSNMLNVEKDSLTFFEPLKEESSLTRSTILQSVLGIFSFKKEPKEVNAESDLQAKKSQSFQNQRPTIAEQKTTPRRKESNHETPQQSAENFRSPKKTNSKKSRPGSLEITPVYKTREHLHGSEVEMRLKNFSTMFRDIPRMISGNNAPIMQQARSSFSSAATSSEGNLRQFWMPDEHCHECYECGDRFTTFRRRHHCRICGHIFCKRCCYLLIPGEVMGFHGMLRSCTYCYKLLMTHDPTSTKVNSHSLSMTENDGMSDVYQMPDTVGKSGSLLNDQTNMGSLKHVRSGRSRSLISIHGSPVDDMPTHMNITSPSTHDISMKASAYEIFDATPGVVRNYDNMFENNSGGLSPERFHEIWAKIDDDRDGLEFRDHRYRLRKFTMSITGSEMVDWLINNQESSTREQACSVGQAFLDSNWIKSVVDDRIFHDAYCLYQRGQTATTFAESSVHFTTVTGSDDLVHVKKTSRLPLAALELDFAVDSEPTWVREISNENDEDGSFSDDQDSSFWTNVSPLYKPLQSQTDIHLSDEDSSSSSRSIRSVSSYVEIDQNTIKYKRPRDRVGVDGYSPHHTSSLMHPVFVDDSLTEINADFLRSYLAWNGMYQNISWMEQHVVWRESNLHNSNVPSRAKQAFLRLQKIYFRHSMLFLQQLLDSEGLDRSWADIVVPLARRVCDSVIPDTDVKMDICHYVHVKKLLDGSPGESRLINGVVFTKNVVHNGMRTLIDKPVIMLIATPLEYQRKHYKLSTLEPIVQQENEFFKNLALRIAGRSPSVVISQCSVSHKARHLLSQAGISLVINVKQTVMEMLSRCTGADVARSIDQLQTVALGSCSRFRVTRHYNGQRNFSCGDGILSKTKGNSRTTDAFKSLVYVEGCNSSKGCTVILRESPSYVDAREGDTQCRKRLSQVKEVFQFLIKIMYHAKLEISYLMDQQDMAKSFPVPSKKDRRLKNLISGEIPPDNVFFKSMSVDGEFTECPMEDQPTPPLLNTASNSISSIASDVRTLTPEHSDCDSGTDATLTHPRLTHSYLHVTGRPQGGAVSDYRPSVASALSAKSSLFNESMQSVLLSISPFIQPNQPFLLTCGGENSPLRNYLPPTLFWSDMFCKHPDHAGKMWSTRNRKRTESTDRLDDLDVDSSSFRSRSGTSESFATSQNMWRTPQHQKSIESEFSNAYEEMLSAMESDEHLMDKENVGPQPRNSTFKDKSDSGTSSATKYLTKQSSQISTRSNISRDDTRLSAWEKLIMRDVLTSGPERPRTSAFKPSPRSSSPVGENVKHHAGDSKHRNQFGINTMTWKAVDHVFISTPLTMPANSKEMRDLIADYRACGSALEAVTMERVEDKDKDVGSKVEEEEILVEENFDSSPIQPLDCLDPRNHQHIFVLFSSYSTRSPNAPNSCVIPWAVDIDFYRGNDITLGGFLERYCFRPSYHCPSPTCKRPMVEHVRSFVHGTTCLNIVLKELAKPITVPDILSWSWDPVTHVTTDLKPLSRDAWSMSFAKFLELRLQSFNSPSQYQHVDDDTEPSVVPPFKSFQFFILRDIVAAFKCFEINVFEIALPSPSIQFDKNTDWRKSIEGEEKEDQDLDEERSEFQKIVDEMKVLSKVGYEAMDSIHDLIVTSRTSNPLDQPLSDQSEVSADVTSLNQIREKYFDELLERYQEERYHMRDCVDKLHLKLQSIRLDQFEQQQQTREDAVETVAMETEPNTEADHTEVEIYERDRVELLRGLLELTCRICRVVHDWNATIGAVADMDRATRRGSRAVNLYTLNPIVSNRKVGGQKNKEWGLRQANSLKTVNEDEAEDSSLPTAGNDDVGTEDSSVKPENGENSNVLTSAESVPAKSLPNKKANADKPDVKHSSVKRISRTASTVSMYFVSHLLNSSSHSQVSPPFPASEHYLLQNCIASQVVVRDAEPSSIIAYTLRTPEYRCYVTTDFTESMGPVDNKIPPPSDQTEDKVSATGGAERTNDGNGEDTDMIIDPHVEFKGISGWKSEDKLGVSASPVTSHSTGPHTEVEFEDSNTKFYCKVYFAAGFKALRAQILDCTEEDYISSLSRCVRWAARGGKSGSAFHKTLDDRLVLKQMSRFDLHSFLELAPSFFEYITHALKSKSPTALSKILGVYRVSFNNTTTNQSFKQDILVMENLFYKRNISQVFDLKGSVRNRHVKTDSESVPSFSTSPNPSSPAQPTSIGLLGSTPASRNNQVLLDENLLTIMRDHPLYIHEHTKLLIKKAITDDAHFLSSHEIIDYSLLVGIDDERKEIVVGIIDYMRTFTWDKKLEMHWKSIVPARHGARSMPTVVHPELYRSRFCEAMDRYFQVVPDRWFEMQAYQPKPCH